ncbi:MAG: DivIVA domain-containing protein [Mycoplasmatota bacterium]
MDKFNRALRGYDVKEVNDFLDQTIIKVENMIVENRRKDEQIKSLSGLVEENETLKSKLATYQRMEETLNKAIFMAQKTSDQMRLSAHKDSEVIVNDAKQNANRIVNEALMKAEKIQLTSEQLTRNIHMFKKRLRNVVEAQLEVIDDIDNITL